MITFSIGHRHPKRELLDSREQGPIDLCQWCKPPTAGYLIGPDLGQGSSCGWPLLMTI